MGSSWKDSSPDVVATKAHGENRPLAPLHDAPRNLPTARQLHLRVRKPPCPAHHDGECLSLPQARPRACLPTTRMRLRVLLILPTSAASRMFAALPCSVDPA